MVEFELAVKNDGPFAKPAIVSNVLSASLIDCRTTCSGATRGASCGKAASGNSVARSVTLPVHATATVHVQCKATCAATTFVNRATIAIADGPSCIDINNENNVASATVVVSAAVSVDATTTLDRVPCKGERASLVAHAAAGKAPYTFALDGSSAFQSSNEFRVSAGKHTITVKDANGCTALSNEVLFVEPAADVRD